MAAKIGDAVRVTGSEVGDGTSYYPGTVLAKQAGNNADVIVFYPRSLGDSLLTRGLAFGHVFLDVPKNSGDPHWRTPG